MKGSAHIFLSLLTGCVILAPLTGVLHWTWVPVILAGIFFGSIAPDIDKGKGSAIFHSAIPGAKGRRFFITPVIGYFLYYFCYKPLSVLFRGIFGEKILPKQGHRELPHSPIGIVCISLLFTFWVWLICCLLSYVPYLGFLRGNLLIWVFGAAFFLGCLLHLIEDTCDNAGIHYLYPFRFRRVRGTLRAGDIRMKIFAAVLVIAAVLLFTGFYTGHPPGYYALSASVLVPACLWLIFLAASGVPAKKGNWE
jgi:hypothetical protein